MDLGPGSKCLDPWINLKGRPNPFAPIHILLKQTTKLLLICSFKDPKNMSAGLSWAQCDQCALFLKSLQTAEMLITKRGALFKSIFAVSAPKNETSHRRFLLQTRENNPLRMAQWNHQRLCS